MNDFETCYFSNNLVYERCDPVGYFDGDNGYKRDGILACFDTTIGWFPVATLAGNFKFDDGPCLVPPAGVAFHPDNTHLSGCHVNPFETCSQYGNRAKKYCWSKSYFLKNTTGRPIFATVSRSRLLSTPMIVRTGIPERPDMWIPSPIPIRADRPNPNPNPNMIHSA